MANEMLSVAYEQVDPKKAARLKECATFLQFAADGQQMKLHRANFCRVRLCPMCSWRRALKTGGQMAAIVDEMNRREPMAYVLATFTIRSVPGDQLSSALDLMMRGWQRMTQRVAFKSAVLGTYRGLEVTHNVNPDSPSYDTYHPHFHALFAVKPRYFSGRYYMKQTEWQRLWQEACRLDYVPSVDVRRVKGGTGGAIAEVAKYAVKPGSLLPDDWDLTVDGVRVLDGALAGRKLVAYGGLMADVHRQLHLDDPEDGDLIGEGAGLEVEDKQLLSFAWYTGYRQYFGV